MLQALRREMDARFQRADLELARARQRIRKLEARLPPDGQGGADHGHIVASSNAGFMAGDCPQCEAVGGLCIDCERYLDGLADAYDPPRPA
jgi:hypothetical protein